MRRGAARHGRAFLLPLIAGVALAAVLLFLAISRGPFARASSGNIVIAVGCASSPLPTDIIFAAQPTANGAFVHPIQQMLPTSSRAVPVGQTGMTAVNIFDLSNPQDSLECGAVVQDMPPDIDANPNTVDTGTVTYSLQTLGGRFAILNTGTGVDSLACAQTTGGVAAFEGCTGGEYTKGASIVTPNPALVITVGLAPGVPFSSLGTLSGVAGSNSGLTLTATYTRDPSLSANPAAVPPGPESAASAVTIGIVAPTYLLTLAAAPATIPASPRFVTPTAPGAGISGQGSVLTASLATVQTTIIGAIVLGQPPTTTTVGVEPGTVTFVTNLGLFGDQPLPLSQGKQTVALACGQLPNSNLVYNPASFSFQPFSFTGCQTVTTTLYGGGQAGQATVIATFVGSITGTQAQSAAVVALSAKPSVIALAPGCSQVLTPASLAPNTPISSFVSNEITPPAAVSAVWQYNNATQAYQALYFTAGGAPTGPNPVVGPNQSVYVCLTTSATVAIGP